MACRCALLDPERRETAVVADRWAVSVLESVAAIITYGAGTASGNSPTTVDSMQPEGVVVDGRDGVALAHLDDVDVHALVADHLAEVARPCGHRVSPTITLGDVDAGNAPTRITSRAGEPGQRGRRGTSWLGSWPPTGPAATSAGEDGRRRSALPISGLSGRGACPDNLRNSLMRSCSRRTPASVAVDLQDGAGEPGGRRRAARGAAWERVGRAPRAAEHDAGRALLGAPRIAPTGGFMPGTRRRAIAPPSSISTNYGSAPWRATRRRPRGPPDRLPPRRQPKPSHTDLRRETDPPARAAARRPRRSRPASPCRRGRRGPRQPRRARGSRRRRAGAATGPSRRQGPRRGAPSGSSGPGHRLPAQRER